MEPGGLDQGVLSLAQNPPAERPQEVSRVQAVSSRTPRHLGPSPSRLLTLEPGLQPRGPLGSQGRRGAHAWPSDALLPTCVVREDAGWAQADVCDPGVTLGSLPSTAACPAFSGALQLPRSLSPHPVFVQAIQRERRLEENPTMLTGVQSSLSRHPWSLSPHPQHVPAASSPRVRLFAAEPRHLPALYLF